MIQEALEKLVYVLDLIRCQKLINKTRLFQYSYTDISATLGIKGTILLCIGKHVIGCVLYTKFKAIPFPGAKRIPSKY